MNWPIKSHTPSKYISLCTIFTDHRWACNVIQKNFEVEVKYSIFEGSRYDNIFDLSSRFGYLWLEIGFESIQTCLLWSWNDLNFLRSFDRWLSFYLTLHSWFVLIMGGVSLCRPKVMSSSWFVLSWADLISLWWFGLLKWVEYFWRISCFMWYGSMEIWWFTQRYLDPVW